MAFPVPYTWASSRYDSMSYRHCDRSGLKLSAISLGLRQNFGADDVFETGPSILRCAFDHGTSHFDLANNYRSPCGSRGRKFWTGS
jgi:L-glyceraldehyde 3-phosphate reductase